MYEDEHQKPADAVGSRSANAMANYLAPAAQQMTKYAATGGIRSQRRLNITKGESPPRTPAARSLYVQMIETQNNLLRIGLQKAHETREIPQVEPEFDGKVLTHKILDAMGVLKDPKEWENEHDSEGDGAVEGKEQSSQSPPQEAQQDLPRQQQWAPPTPQLSGGLPSDSSDFGHFPSGIQYSPHHFDPQMQRNNSYAPPQHEGFSHNQQSQSSHSGSSEPSPPAQNQAFAPGSDAHAQFHQAPGVQFAGSELMQRGGRMQRLQAQQHQVHAQFQHINYTAPETTMSMLTSSPMPPAPAGTPAYVDPSNLNYHYQQFAFGPGQYAQNPWPGYDASIGNVGALEMQQMNPTDGMFTEAELAQGLP
ncbi:MAG: hypothetical protein Q9217_004119 [Psora testacea]